MKKLLILLTITCFVFINYTVMNTKASDRAQEVIISKGTFLKVMPLKDICTSTSDIDDGVTFINLYDMYVDETDAVPEKSLIYGYIEDIREPVQGSNAAIKIKFNKIVTPEKKVIPIDAYLFSPNDNYIGGEQTNPKYYVKTPHFTQGFGRGIADGVLQYAPLNIREEGKHTIIKPGAEMYLILNEDLKIN